LRKSYLFGTFLPTFRFRRSSSMKLNKIIFILLFCAPVFSMMGCGGGSGDPTIPANPVLLVGDWQGTYENDVVGVGIIQCTFFMDGTTLKVTYDLQNGEVVGTSSVSITGRDLLFIGVGTRLQQISGTVNDSSNRINGTLIIDYTLSGTRTGAMTITKI
jgi:hypothetical protein